MTTHTKVEAKSTAISAPAIQSAHSGLLPHQEQEDQDRPLFSSEDRLRSPSSPTPPPINPSVGHSFGTMAIGSISLPVLQPTAIANQTVQRQENIEEEKLEEEPIQAKAIAPLSASFLQRQEVTEEQEKDETKSIQAKAFPGQGLTHFSQGHGQRVTETAVQSAPRVPVLQRKLTIGQPNDPYEQEADRVADQVMRMLEPTASPQAIEPLTGSLGIQRVCSECQEQQRSDQEEQPEQSVLQMKLSETSTRSQAQRQLKLSDETQEQEHIQAKEQLGQPSTGLSSLEPRLIESKGGGQPLSQKVRGLMEPRFGYDFSHVRIHTDSEAARLSQTLGAQAFTHGLDIYFNAGKFAPDSRSGQQLLAHELTHTIQQEASLRPQLSSHRTLQLKAIRLKENVANLQCQLESLHISHTSTSIQGYLGILPSLADILGVAVPKDPIAALEEILNALDDPSVKIIVDAIPGVSTLKLALRTTLETLKLIKFVIDNKDKIISEIKKFIESKLDTVSGIVEAKLKDLFGITDPRHYEVVWKGYALPMLEHLKDQWWETIKDTLWEQIWPFEGITTLADAPNQRKGLGKDLGNIFDHISSGFNNLTDANFSKAIDDFLLVQKGMVGIANRFYGWVALIIVASETLAGALAGAAVGGAGAVPGALAGFGAGLATAGTIGEVLLATTAANELAVLLKSIVSLSDFDSSLLNEEKAKANAEYYKRIAESGLALGIILALIALAHLGGKIATALLGKLLQFLPKNAQRILLDLAKTIERGAKGEKPGAVAADTINFKKNPPELNPELATLRENVKSPDNIKSVSDPELMGKYDMEVRVGDHIYRRNKGNRTWCRFSDVFCGIQGLEDVNAKVNSATGIKELKGISFGEELSVPYKKGRTRAQVMEVTDEFIKVKFKSKREGGENITQWIRRDEFERLLADGDIIRWSLERQRLMQSRPKYNDGLVETVWERAKQPNGKVYDPHTRQELKWDPSKNRWEQWHMGHKPGHEYAKLVDQYVSGEITWEQFLKEYNNPSNYRPEHYLENISHKHEL